MRIGNRQPRHSAVATVTGSDGDEMPARFAGDDRTVVTSLALAWHDTEVAELCRFPGRGTVTAIARQARLRMLDWRCIGRLAVMAGLALAGQDARVAEYRLITCQHGQPKAIGRETLVDRVERTAHHRAYSGRSAAELAVALGVA